MDVVSYLLANLGLVGVFVTVMGWILYRYIDNRLCHHFAAITDLKKGQIGIANDLRRERLKQVAQLLLRCQSTVTDCRRQGRLFDGDRSLANAAAFCTATDRLVDTLYESTILVSRATYDSIHKGIKGPAYTLSEHLKIKMERHDPFDENTTQLAHETITAIENAYPEVMEHVRRDFEAMEELPNE